MTPQQAREAVGQALQKAAPGSDIDSLDPDADLFARFTGRRGHDGLASIQVPGRDAVLSVAVARVETAKQQDLIASKEK